MKKLAALLFTAAACYVSYGQQLTTSGTFLDVFSPEVPLGFTLGQGVSYGFPTNLKDNVPGDLSILRAETSLSYRKRWEENSLNVTFNYEYSDYDWGGGAPSFFGSTNDLGLTAIYQHKFDASDWGAYLLGTARLGAETGDVSLTSGDSYFIGGGASYSFFKDLTVSFGALAIFNPEQATRVWPVAFIDWRINDHLQLRTFNGATLVYDIDADRETVLDFTVQYNSRIFRLNSQPIPTQAGVVTNPVVEEESVSATVGVTHRFGGPFYIRAFVQGDFFREYQFRANRNKYQTIKTDPGATVGFEIGANF